MKELHGATPELREPTPDELRQALTASLTRPLMKHNNSVFLTKEFLEEEGYPFAYSFVWNCTNEQLEITRIPSKR